MYDWWVTAAAISKKLTSLSLFLSLPFSIYLFLSVHNSKFSAICANSSFSYGTSKTTLSVPSPPPLPSISRSSSLAIFFHSLPRPTSRPTKDYLIANLSLSLSLSLCRALVKNSHASSTFAGTCEVINWPSGPFCELISYNQIYF